MWPAQLPGRAVRGAQAATAKLPMSEPPPMPTLKLALAQVAATGDGGGAITMTRFWLAMTKAPTAKPASASKGSGGGGGGAGQVEGEQGPRRGRPPVRSVARPAAPVEQKAGGQTMPSVPATPDSTSSAATSCAGNLATWARNGICTYRR